MRFENIRVGMKLQFVKEGRDFLKGEVVLVEMIDGSDRSILVRDMDGDIEWIFNFDLAYIEPAQEACAAQEAIDYIKMYFGSTSEYEAILRKHEKEPNDWDGNLRGLNGLPIEQLRELLFGQNEQASAGKKSGAAMADTQMEAFKGTKVRILKGDKAGLVLPIVDFLLGGQAFILQGGASFRTSDAGVSWEFVDGNLNTNLSPEDYESMIDFALMTGDKEWFNELLQKSNEGAIS